MTTVANVEQAETWNGDEGPHWVEHQDRYDQMMGRLTPHLLEAMAVVVTDHVLDIGCGCGETTRIAGRLAVDGSCLGVDLSVPMLRRATELAREEGVDNVRFQQADAQVHRFNPEGFDVVASRNGVMFFSDPVAAFANMRQALRPGGQLAFLCWQDALANEWLAAPAGAALAYVPVPDLGGGGPGPFSLADVDHIRGLLAAAEFGEIVIEPVSEAVRLGADPDDVVAFIAGTGLARALLADVDEPTAAKATDAMREALAPYAAPDGVWLGSGSWLVTARQ